MHEYITLPYYEFDDGERILNVAHRVIGQEMLNTIRKLFVTGHLDREGFTVLLQNYEMTPMQMCEFIDVAEDSRIRYLEEKYNLRDSNE